MPPKVAPPALPTGPKEDPKVPKNIPRDSGITSLPAAIAKSFPLYCW